jgi:MFS family permease
MMASDKRGLEGAGTADDAEGQLPTFRHPRAGMANWKWPCTMLGFSVYLILNGYDVSNIANIQPPIYDAFGHVELLPWVGAAFSALSSSVILLFSRLSGFLPLKRMFIVWQLFLFVGSVIGGSASSINAVIIGRALSGVGAGGIYAT